MNDEYWVIYILDFSGPISSGRFERDDLEFKVLKVVKGTAEDAEKVALSYMAMKKFGREILWQKVKNGLIELFEKPFFSGRIIVSL